MKNATIKEIIVNKNKYKILCHRDEEERLQILARKIDERGTEIINTLKHRPTDTTLFLLIALELEDQIDNLNAEIKNLHKSDNNNAKVIDQVVSRLENFIKKIENSSY